MKLTPLAKTVLDYLQAKGDASPRDVTNDLGIDSGSFTARISELRSAGYKIADEWRRHPTTGRRYKRYFWTIARAPIKVIGGATGAVSFV